MLGKIEGRRRSGRQRIRWLCPAIRAITGAMSMNLGKLWEMVRDREVLCIAVCGAAKSGT